MSPVPRTPDDYDVPDPNGPWMYSNADSSNSHTWLSDDGRVTISVSRSLWDSVYVDVKDKRISGAGGSERIIERDLEIDEEEEHSVVWAIEQAIDWMESTNPGDWEHPDVSESVFYAPDGYEVEKYYITDREVTIYYRRIGQEMDGRVGAETPDDYELEDCPFLYIHMWRGSRNATVGITPWTYAHGPGSKYPEVREVVDTPEGCGLGLALELARGWARENQDINEPMTTLGQSSLKEFEADA